MAEGRSNQGIADKLVISLRAVKRTSRTFRKLGLPSGATDSRRVLAVLLTSTPRRASRRNPTPKRASSRLSRGDCI